MAVTLHEYGWWTWRPRFIPEDVAAGLSRVGERMGWWDRETLRLAVKADTLLVSNRRHADVVRRRVSRESVIVPLPANIPPVSTSRAAARVALRRLTGASADTAVIVFFGFVHPVKGIGYLLDALSRLRRHRDIRLVIAGGFESLALPADEAAAYRTEVENAIADMGLVDVVRVTGWLEAGDISLLLTGADAAAFCFTQGVSGRNASVLCALQHGLPTVATRADPPDEEFRDGDGILLVPPRDAEAVAATLARVLDDPGLADRLGARARELAAAHGWGTIVDRHLGLYDAMCTGQALEHKP